MEGLRALERELSGLVQSRGQVLGEKKVSLPLVLADSLFSSKFADVPFPDLHGKQMHETAIKEREEIAKVLCATYQLKGYDYSPLEKVKIDEILDKLKDVKKRHDNMIRQMKVSFPRRVSSRSNEEFRADLSFLRFLSLSDRLQKCRGSHSSPAQRSYFGEGDPGWRTNRPWEAARESSLSLFLFLAILFPPSPS